MRVEDGVLVLTGVVDHRSVAAWRRRHPVLPPVHEVDAAGVTFLNSSGAALLVDAARALRPVLLVLRSPSRAALRPLQVMGLDQLLDVRPGPVGPFAVADLGRSTPRPAPAR
ncbi:STAS domain-containing protein [Klenkia marina]|uniref:STAS domain-containing protein n=1 Tax=Klenkia marina TaxID=1960309 RepID=UPI001403AC8D|nr:STAS domain-containing protein [Klenkia marina]